MKSLLPTLVAIAPMALQYAVIPLVLWLLAKLVSLADAHAQLAAAKSKQVKAARVLDSLAHFTALAAQAEANALKVALDAGKPLPELGAIALTSLKGFLGQNGLQELGELAGIVTDAQLLNITKAAVQAKAAPALLAAIAPKPASPPVPSAA